MSVNSLWERDPESSKRHRCQVDESLLKSCWRRGTEGPTAYIHPFTLYSKQTGFVSAQQWYTSYWLCLVFLCCCCSVSTQRDGRLSLKLRDIIKLNTSVCEHAAFKLFLRLETPKSQNVWNAADVVICRAFYHARLSTLGSITNEIFLLRRPSGEIWWFPLSVRLYFFPGLFILLIPLTFFCLSLLFLFFYSSFLVCPDSSHAPLLLPPFVLCRLRAQNVDTLFLEIQMSVLCCDVAVPLLAGDVSSRRNSPEVSEKISSGLINLETQVSNCSAAFLPETPPPSPSTSQYDRQVIDV